VLLRPIEERDLPVVRELRNRNRSWFFDDREISADQHSAWFDSLGERGVAFYVLEEDERVVGTISITPGEHGSEVGNLTLDDAYRGRGLMTRAVQELCSGPGPWFARVKQDNIASAAVFERAGFESTLYFERT
jgi:RimJ/RimL family protein N-acetyltransferase